MTTASEIEAQAAAWLVRRDGGALSAEEQAEFEAWTAADARARAAFLRLERGWQRADGLKRLRPLEGSVDPDLLASSPFEPVSMDEYSAREQTGKSLDVVVDHAGAHRRAGDLGADDRVAGELSARSAAENPPRAGRVFDITDAVEYKPRRRRWLPALAAAAALALVAVGALTWFEYERSGWQEYATDFGGLERIVLDDGSIVSLNTYSAMRVQFTPESRQIILERGEALFKVAHDASRPFDVKAGDTIVRAVGTEFSVRVRDLAGKENGDKDVEVLVKEGRVAIDPPKMQKPLERSASLPASMSTLSAGEAVRITAKRRVSSVEKVAEADVDRKLSWTEGRLWFERQTLKDVVAEFNRYNRRQMVIADPAIENLRIGGGFSATDPESFIAALEKTLGVRAFPSPESDGDEAEVIRLVGTRESPN